MRFLSADIPEQYAKVKYEVISLLKEFESTASRANVPVEVRINGEIERRSEEESFAKEQFGIEPRVVQVRERGVLADRPILLGAAFRSGLEKVVVPFFEPGVPVEYQLVQAMNTVSRPARKKLGVLRTDAQVTGGFSPSTMQQTPRQQILDDLEKQYEIVDVDASSPIDASLYACLLAVQPSSLSPEQMTNFVAAVEAGVPTAIFEDPMPIAMLCQEQESRSKPVIRCLAADNQFPKATFATCGKRYKSTSQGNLTLKVALIPT